MAITQPEIERILTRNTADIEAIYEIVADVQQTLIRHDARFDGIDATLAEVLRRLPG